MKPESRGCISVSPKKVGAASEWTEKGRGCISKSRGCISNVLQHVVPRERQVRIFGVPIRIVRDIGIGEEDLKEELRVFFYDVFGEKKRRDRE